MLMWLFELLSHYALAKSCEKIGPKIRRPGIQIKPDFFFLCGIFLTLYKPVNKATHRLYIYILLIFVLVYSCPHARNDFTR
jgi:hypothetical protein